MKDYYCKLPFQAIEIRHNGAVSVCCDYRPGIQGMNFLDNTIDEIFQSHELSTVRQTMLDNGRPWKNCNRCWIKEKHGIESLRETSSNDNALLNFDTNTYQIREISLKPGNTCNQMCIICDHVNSSMLLAEDRVIFPNNIETVERHWWKDETKWEEILKHCNHVKKIKIYGGEPLLMKETLNFLQKLIDFGLSKNITLHFATNGSILNDDILYKLKQFKRIEIVFSADGVGDTFEYCRYPAKWDTFKHNLIVYQNFLKDNEIEHTLCVFYTISIHNIFNIVESLNEYRYNMDDPPYVFMNIVNQSYYDPSCLPREIKQQLTDRLQKQWRGDYSTNQTLENIINTYNTDSEDDAANFSEFLRITKIRDSMRNRDITQIMPLLKDYF